MLKALMIIANKARQPLLMIQQLLEAEFADV